MQGDPLPPELGQPERRKRGRPPGSVSLTPEIERTILAYVRAGAFLYVAARAAGISERTLDDWLARGEDRHPSRPTSPKLRRFARELRGAQAEARVGAEIRVYRESPAHWLRYAARSKPGHDGWSEPATQGADRLDAQHQLESLIERLDARESAERIVGERFGCGERCRCEEHRRDVEAERLRILGESDG